MEGRREGGKKDLNIPLAPSLPQSTVHVPLIALSQPTELAIIHFWSFSWILEPSMCQHSPHGHHTILVSIPHRTHSSVFLVSEQRQHSALRHTLSGQEQPMVLLYMVRGWRIRPHTSGPIQRVPGQGHWRLKARAEQRLVALVSLRQMFFCDLFGEKLTLGSMWLPLSEIPLGNIRNLREQQQGDIWRLSCYLFRVWTGQIALTEDMGNPWHHWQGARWRATGRAHLLIGSQPPAVTQPVTTLLQQHLTFCVPTPRTGFAHGVMELRYGSLEFSLSIKTTTVLPHFQKLIQINIQFRIPDSTLTYWFFSL